MGEQCIGIRKILLGSPGITAPQFAITRSCRDFTGAEAGAKLKGVEFV